MKHWVRETSRFKLSRLEPRTYKGYKIAGFLEDLDTALIYEDGKAKSDWCGDVCNYVQAKYGGGKYQLYIVDEQGKYIQTKVADLSGTPIFPKLDAKHTECRCISKDLFNFGCRCGFVAS